MTEVMRGSDAWYKEEVPRLRAALAALTERRNMTEIDAIKNGTFEEIRNSNVIIIEEASDGRWHVRQFTAESVMPVSSYYHKRGAARRVLQLLHVGPTAPQTHPETACIGDITEFTE